MRSLRRRYDVAFAALLLLGLSPVAADDLDQMGWYLPLAPGRVWSYENPDDPFDSFTESVFEVIEYEGHVAWRFGRGLDEHVIAYREGGFVTLYGVADDGVVVDLDEDYVFEEIVDGGYFEKCFFSPCDTSLIRVWAEMDPGLRSIYGIDPAYTDMVLFVSFDPDYPPNLHSVVVESNLPEGVTPPAGAVTSLEWYLRGVGMVVIQDVDAASGGLEDRHELVAVTGTDERTPSVRAVDLEAVEPNPFNPRTTIRYRLGEAGLVDVGIYDLAGRRVRTLVDEFGAEGRHAVVWAGRDDAGRSVASGVYVVRLRRGPVVRTQPVTLAK